VPVDHTQSFALGSQREALEMNLDAQREGLIMKRAVLTLCVRPVGPGRDI